MATLQNGQDVNALRINRRTFTLAAGAAVAAVTAGSSATSAAAEPASGGFAESLVFSAGEDDLEVFHVFGLAVTTAGSVLAFAEGRITRHDAALHHIVARRSTDGGHTWGDLQYVRQSDGEQSLINPTPVVDRQSGRVFLFFAQGFQNAGNTGGSPDSSRVFVVSSDDDGVSWSEPTELTSLFDGNPHDWTLHMPGPGHGLQLADNRLIMPIWHRRAVAIPVPERGYGVSVLYSDDSGSTWHNGGSVPLDGAYPVNESRVVERPDGSLFLAGRYASGGIRPRIVSVSHDRGQIWSDPVLDASARPVNAVDAGMARISGGAGSSEPSRIAFSRPDSRSRRNLTVSLSYDEGASWAHSRILTSGPASYSDVVALPDGRIGVLYGRDRHPATASFSANVAFAAFDVAWLTHGADDGSPGARTQVAYDVESLPARSSSGDELTTVDEPTASGGRRLELAGGDYDAFAEVEIAVPASGDYTVRARFRHLADAGVVAVSIDGTSMGGPIDTSTISVRSFKTESLGRIRLRRGRHTIRFTVIDKHVDSAGLRVSPDLITLVAA